MTTKPIQLTERDHEIMYHVRMFGYLRSQEHLLPLFQNRQRVRKRASLLAQHGYLHQLPGRSIYEQAVFGIGNKGARLVEEIFRIPATRVHWPQKHEERSPGFVAHELLNASVIIRIMEAAERTPGLRFIAPQEIFDRAPEATRERFYTAIDPRRPQDGPHNLEARVYFDGIWSTRRIKFDWIFGIEKGRKRSFFYLETDRGTETIRASNLNIASMTKKFLVYASSLDEAQGRLTAKVSKEAFGIPLIKPFFVITARNRRYAGSERMQNAIAWQKKITAGGNHNFLFADRSFLTASDPITAPLFNGRGDETSLLA